MAKLTSQNSSKSKTAKARVSAEGKKPKFLGNGAANSKRKVADPVSKHPAAESAENLHAVAGSSNGHSVYPSRLPQPDSSLDLQERVRDMVKLAKEQGYVT